MRATDRLRSRFGKAEMPDLALLNQFLHRSGDVFDWGVRVNTMLIEKIDGLDPEPLERGFGDLLYMLRPAVESYPTRLSVGLEFESELGGDHDLPTDGSQRLAHEFFVYEWAVNLR